MPGWLGLGHDQRRRRRGIAVRAPAIMLAAGIAVLVPATALTRLTSNAGARLYRRSSRPLPMLAMAR